MNNNESTIIEQAARVICSGNLVAFPTETVYGLGADAFNEAACLKIYAAKGRPVSNPLIVHVNTIQQAEKIAVFSDLAYLASSLWPGPLTMVLPKKKGNLLADCVTAGLDTVAIRIPAHPVAQELIRKSNTLIAAPSANKSGYLSPTSYLHVKANFKETIFTIPTSKACKYGLESTIIDLSTQVPTILRPGFITPECVEKIIGTKVEVADKASAIKAPGMMYSHYAPKTPLRLNATSLQDQEVGLGFGTNEFPALGSLNLSPEGNLETAAANLFAYLHDLDVYATKHRLKSIAVAKIPNESVGKAINDRLIKAATDSLFTGID